MRLMAYRWIAAALLLAAFAWLCTGCVSVPVPPSDMGNVKAGQLGTLTAKVVVAYQPNYQGLAQAAVDRLTQRSTEGYAK